jgi:hypothetical protein
MGPCQGSELRGVYDLVRPELAHTMHERFAYRTPKGISIGSFGRGRCSGRHAEPIQILVSGLGGSVL